MYQESHVGLDGQPYFIAWYAPRIVTTCFSDTTTCSPHVFSCCGINMDQLKGLLIQEICKREHLYISANGHKFHKQRCGRGDCRTAQTCTHSSVNYVCGDPTYNKPYLRQTFDLCGRVVWLPANDKSCQLKKKLCKDEGLSRSFLC